MGEKLGLPLRTRRQGALARGCREPIDEAIEIVLKKSLQFVHHPVPPSLILLI
jgi:hypothetical protein